MKILGKNLATGKIQGCSFLGKDTYSKNITLWLLLSMDTLCTNNIIFLFLLFLTTQLRASFLFCTAVPMALPPMEFSSIMASKNLL